MKRKSKNDVEHSTFLFVPTPQVVYQANCWWDGCFSIDMLKKIEKDCLQLHKVVAVTEGTTDPSNPRLKTIRHSQIAWIPNNNKFKWLYLNLMQVALKLNASNFQFDLYGQVEALQFTEYTSDNSHYDWHTDCGKLGATPRKLSLSLLLSDPTTFEGGDLEMMDMWGITKAQRKQGIISAFPSWTNHRVTPVTRGIRRSIVAWIAGPQFR